MNSLKFHLATGVLLIAAGTLSLAGCGQKQTAEQKAAQTTPAPAPTPTPAPPAETTGETTDAPHTVPDVWRLIEAERAELADAIKAGHLSTLHEIAFHIRGLVAALPPLSDLPEASKSRLDDAVARIKTLAADLDEAGDSGKGEDAARLSTRLGEVLDLVKALYPAELTPAAQYTCTMHPEVVAAAPGQCPKCGMNLVRRTLRPAGGHEDHSSHEMAPHTDHKARHGGQFAMAGNYHLELATPATGEVALYLYDAYTRPLDVRGARATGVLEMPGAEGTGPSLTLKPAADGTAFTGHAPDLEKAAAITIDVTLADTTMNMTFPLGTPKRST